MVTLATYKREIAQKAIDAKNGEAKTPYNQSAHLAGIPYSTLIGWIGKTIYLNDQEKTK